MHVPYIWYVIGRRVVCLHPATLDEREQMLAMLRRLGRRQAFGRI